MQFLSNHNKLLPTAWAVRPWILNMAWAVGHKIPTELEHMASLSHDILKYSKCPSQFILNKADISSDIDSPYLSPGSSSLRGIHII